MNWNPRVLREQLPRLLSLVLGPLIVTLACSGSDDDSGGGGNGGGNGSGNGGPGNNGPVDTVIDSRPPTDECGSVRLTDYQVFNRGWCEWDRDYDFLPNFVRQGITAAIGEPWNGGSYEGDPGEGCGECWEIDTVNATQVVMISDLCPNEGNSLCSGPQFHIDLASEAAGAVNGGALTEGHARRVPCPVSGNIHVLVNDENLSYLRVAFLNHRIPVRSVEFRGAGDGVSEPNDWAPLQRSGGGWEVIGGDTTVDRGGTGVVFRLTSAQGEEVESDVVVPSHPERGSTFDLGVQFEDLMPPTGGSCNFITPGDVYVDGWGGIDQVRWTINPWGAAESGNYGETTDGCYGDSGSCIEVENLGQYSGFHLYYREAFPRDMFSTASLRLRTRSGSTMLAVGPSNDGTRCMETRVEVGTEWTQLTFDLADACADLERLNAVTVDNGGQTVALLVDDVQFSQ